MNNKKQNIPEEYALQVEANYDYCCVYDNPTPEHLQRLKEAKDLNIFKSVELRLCYRSYPDGDKETYYLVVGRVDSLQGELEYSLLIDTEDND